MTRLTADHIRHIPHTLAEYDTELVAKTGHTLKEIACRAAAVNRPKAGRITGTVVGVVPISWGQGRIPGFCDVLAGIAVHLGFQAFIAEAADVAGLGECIARGADILLLADDHCYAALNPARRNNIDNSAATGRGFAWALALMAGGLKDRCVLVIGCGPVGENAAAVLDEMGARICLVDRRMERAASLSARLGQGPHRVLAASGLDAAFKDCRLVLDASPAADVILRRHVTAETMVASPGVPHGLTPAALHAVGDRFIHDPLQLGTAVMLMQAALG